MTFKEGVVWGVVSVALFLGANSPANACTTDGWDSASGAGVAGSPAPVSRFSGLCAYELNGTQYTQDNTPSAESRYRARFYVLPKLTGAGTADVFVAYSDAGSTAVFRVRWNGTQFVFDATPAGGTSFNITAANSQWHLVEIDWQQGAGNFRAWVDGDRNGSINVFDLICVQNIILVN